MISLSGGELSLPAGLDKEWILTDGRGGFVSSTALGINTRRYHGFFVAPSEERKLLLSKLEEEIIVGTKVFPLSSNIYNDVIHPTGYQFIQSFLFSGWMVEWIYQVDGIIIKKKILLPKYKQALLVFYEVIKSNTPFKLRILPLLNFRSYHSLTKANDNWSAKSDGSLVEIISPYKFYLFTTEGYFKPTGLWYYDMTYPRERERGLDYKEDHFNIGVFEMELQEGKKGCLVCSTDLLKESPYELFEREKNRAEHLLRQAEFEIEDDLKMLIFSADSFFVHWQGRKSIIAGYHWFTDWGRDTMISLPGLAIPTGRMEEGKEIIFSFLQYLKNGLLPNAFMESEIIYNSADAVLWLFWAVYKFLQTKWDENFAREIFPYLSQIVDELKNGKADKVWVDGDGFLWTGDENTCLTWMDSKVNEKPVIARYGKAVEVNALWLFSLSFLEELSRKLGKNFPYSDLLSACRESFPSKFTAPIGLYDVVRGKEKDGSLRPNQVIAASLPYIPLSYNKKREILQMALEKLYIPFGLRSLAKEEPGYRGRYEGGVEERDSSYHQGTAWAFLIGPFGELLRQCGEANLKWLIYPFKGHLLEAGLGSVSEIFDGDYPWSPKGCISQAWSVAELLRLLWETKHNP
ncbi:glycogen debranching enzyme family protein [bacterium]|nr:glycogen debranching enzyme family protein [bacterium]